MPIFRSWSLGGCSWATIIKIKKKIVLVHQTQHLKSQQIQDGLVFINLARVH